KELRERLRSGDLTFAEAERIAKPSQQKEKKIGRPPLPILYKVRKDGFNLKITYRMGQDKQELIQKLEEVLDKLKNS
ncbi:MAG: hypothetical protein ACRDBG_23110, partial [Waterburya sp.]